MIPRLAVDSPERNEAAMAFFAEVHIIVLKRRESVDQGTWVPFLFTLSRRKPFPVFFYDGAKELIVPSQSETGGFYAVTQIDEVLDFILAEKASINFLCDNSKIACYRRVESSRYGGKAFYKLPGCVFRALAFAIMNLDEELGAIDRSGNVG